MALARTTAAVLLALLAPGPCPTSPLAPTDAEETDEVAYAAAMREIAKFAGRGCALPLPKHRMIAELRLQAEEKQARIRAYLRDADLAWHFGEWARVSADARGALREDPANSEARRFVEVADRKEAPPRSR